MKQLDNLFRGALIIFVFVKHSTLYLPSQSIELIHDIFESKEFLIHSLKIAL